MPPTTSKYPPHRNVRVDETRWKAFGRGVGERSRSTWLSDFIDWVNLDPATWVKALRISRLRGEVLGSVILQALSRYVARHEDLLTAHQDDDE